MDRPAHIATPQTPHKAWTLILASLGLFMVALDTLVVTTALPVLRVDLGASLPDLEWTVNAYNLAFACLLLTGAALGDRFGCSGACAERQRADRGSGRSGSRRGDRDAADADAHQRCVSRREARRCDR